MKNYKEVVGIDVPKKQLMLIVIKLNSTKSLRMMLRVIKV
jgi:hypothetical protein